MTMSETIKLNLEQFHGTRNWWKHTAQFFLYTDGIKYVVEKCEAFWLLDVVQSFQLKKDFWNMKYQFWHLEVDPKANEGVIIMRADMGEPELINQKIPHTDFPVHTLDFYVVSDLCLQSSLSKVMMLPGEY